MSTTTSIEWTSTVQADGSITPGKTWNPIRGCSLVSEGCRSCYAMKQAHRFSGPGKPYEGLTRLGPHGPVWTGEVRLVPEVLTEPLRWRKPCRIFVNSMSDLFHESVPDEFIDRVFAVMALTPQHTHIVLTKRAERMRAYFSVHDGPSRLGDFIDDGTSDLRDRIDDAAGEFGACHANIDVPGRWPLPNAWLLVSCENQQTADERIPLLLQTPAAVRGVSLEPLLGPISLTWESSVGVGRLSHLRGRRQPHKIDWPGLDWVIVGGESGPGARPCRVQWIRDVVAQCEAAGVKCFVKQLGARPIVPAGRQQHWEWGGQIGRAARFEPTDPLFPSSAPWRVVLADRKGGNPKEWPEDLRVRQFPEERGATTGVSE